MAADALDVRKHQTVDRHNIAGNNRVRNGIVRNNDAGNNGNDFDLLLGPTGIDVMDAIAGTIPCAVPGVVPDVAIGVDEIIDEILEGKLELLGYMTDPQCMEVIEEGIIEACSDRVVTFIRGLMGDDILSVDVAAIAFANLYLAHRATCDAEMDLYDAEMFAGNAIVPMGRSSLLFRGAQFRVTKRLHTPRLRGFWALCGKVAHPLSEEPPAPRLGRRRSPCPEYGEPANRYDGTGFRNPNR